MVYNWFVNNYWLSWSVLIDDRTKTKYRIVGKIDIYIYIFIKILNRNTFNLIGVSSYWLSSFTRGFRRWKWMCQLHRSRCLRTTRITITRVLVTCVFSSGWIKYYRNDFIALLLDTARRCHDYYFRDCLTPLQFTQRNHNGQKKILQFYNFSSIPGIADSFRCH